MRLLRELFAVSTRVNNHNNHPHVDVWGSDVRRIMAGKHLPPVQAEKMEPVSYNSDFTIFQVKTFTLSCVFAVSSDSLTTFF